MEYLEKDRKICAPILDNKYVAKQECLRIHGVGIAERIEQTL